MKTFKNVIAWLLFASAVAVMAALLVGGTPKVEHYETHVVAPGETLWSICKEYNPKAVSMDEILYETRKVNNMRTSNIYVGDVIEVAVME
jgi:LysM repeat protein